MQHLENAQKILEEWRHGPREDGVIRACVYDSNDCRIYTAACSPTDYDSLIGAAAQIGREASLFGSNAAYFSMVTELCVEGTERTMPIWCGSQRGGTCASASTPSQRELYLNPHLAEAAGLAFWQAYTQPESEYTQ